MYQAINDIESKFGSKKKQLIYCKKGDILMPITETEPIIVVTKNNAFSVKKEEIKKAEMNPSRLLKTVIEVSENPVVNEKNFPIVFIKGITEGKEWEGKFLEMVKHSSLKKEIKTKILFAYENYSE
jgi:hypothetical protein